MSEQSTARSPKRPSVLISGASIAGPTLAYWLHRYGFDVTVVERADGLRMGGQAIDVRGPGLEVAARMGVLDAVRARCTDLRGMSTVDDEGNELSRTTEYTASGGQIDSPDIEILRDDLARILVDAGGSGIEYLFDDSIDVLEQDDREVRVVFRSGTARAFDLVVGADGVHSTTRRLVFGPEEDHLHHLGGYLGVWSAPNHLGLDRWEVAYEIPGSGLLGALVMTARDNKEARVFIGIDSPEPPSRFLPGDVVEQKRLVADAYAHARWEMPRLLKEMWNATDFHLDSVAHIRMDSWSRGRVALLGDAGYCASPASGMGTTMAMAAAYVLADELRAAAGDHRGAFTAYERRMRPFVDTCQRIALVSIAHRQRTQGRIADLDEQFARHLDTDFDEVVAELHTFRLEDR
ncbi:FAD-dependent monooxygenase [Streptomyces sp. NPDC048664]|uniref:FAD-dependent monooxygenase n=1 Tax=Streptomyces sp. NPDC048664 TaxID=3154505 RepID=UPI00342748E3